MNFQFEAPVSLVSYSLQVVAGLVTVWVLWMMAVSAESADSRRPKPVTVSSQLSLAETRVLTDVFTGYSNGVTLQNSRIDTISDNQQHYKNFGGDGNGSSSGGTSFTYSFWVLIRDPQEILNYPFKCPLFIKGDPKRYKTFHEKPDPADRTRSKTIVTDEVLVKSPMVSIYRVKDLLNVAIDFNTTTDLHATSVVTGMASDDVTLRYNIMSLVVGQWAMWTIAFDDTRDGLVVSMYINEMPVHSAKFPGQSVIPNMGDLYLFPNVPPSQAEKNANVNPETWQRNVYLSDMTYANYAFSIADIQERVKAGVTRTHAAVISSASLPAAVLQLTTLNRTGNV